MSTTTTETATTARHMTMASRLGELTVVATGDAVTGVYFSRHWPRPDRAAFGPAAEAGDDLLATATTQLAEYLDARRTGFDLPIRTDGDAFQRRVWALLNDVGYGETTTYGELAERLGDRTLARDVGAAVARNPLAVLVPCHRVIGKGGRLTGYSGGLRGKAYLLDLERTTAPPAAGQ